MVRKFFSKIKYPLSIIVWFYTSYLFITDTSVGTIRIPIIFAWIPDVLGWNALFIIIGFGLGFATFGICSWIAGELK